MRGGVQSYYLYPLLQIVIYILFSKIKKTDSKIIYRNTKQGYQWPQNTTCECIRQKNRNTLDEYSTLKHPSLAPIMLLTSISVLCSIPYFERIDNRWIKPINSIVLVLRPFSIGWKRFWCKFLLYILIIKYVNKLTGFHILL